MCIRDRKQAIPYAQRWMELDPEDENAPAVIRECKAEIRKRQRSRNKKAKFVPGDTPFEGFDLTGFWDDSMYALKEYVSDPPSDELIASVEEELGYKLPASYIWLLKQHKDVYKRQEEQLGWISNQAEHLEHDHDDLLNEEIREADVLLGIMQKFGLTEKP